MSAEPPVRGNWGRWGDDDQRGAANFADAGVITDASQLVRIGRVVSLAIDLRRDAMPVFSDRQEPFHAMLLDGGDFAAGVDLGDGFGVADDYLALGCHSTTHVDALAHVWYDGVLYNGHDARRVRSYGATRCGIEQLGQLVTRGVLLDVARSKNVPHLDPGYPIDARDVQATIESQDVQIHRGDCVLIRTGWWSVFGQDEQLYYGAAPGLDSSGARLLADLDVSALGADTMAFEVQPESGRFEGGGRTPVSHRFLIRDYGIYILELLDLEELAAASVQEFLFILAPLRIAGGTASPVNPLAVF